MERLSFWTKQAEIKVQAGNRQATGRQQAGNKQTGRQAETKVQAGRQALRYKYLAFMISQIPGARNTLPPTP